MKRFMLREATGPSVAAVVEMVEVMSVSFVEW